MIGKCNTVGAIRVLGNGLVRAGKVSTEGNSGTAGNVGRCLVPGAVKSNVSWVLQCLSRFFGSNGKDTGYGVPEVSVHLDFPTQTDTPNYGTINGAGQHLQRTLQSSPISLGGNGTEGKLPVYQGDQALFTFALSELSGAIESGTRLVGRGLRQGIQKFRMRRIWEMLKAKGIEPWHRAVRRARLLDSECHGTCFTLVDSLLWVHLAWRPGPSPPQSGAGL